MIDATATVTVTAIATTNSHSKAKDSRATYKAQSCGCDPMDIQARWSALMDTIRKGITASVVRIAQHAARNPIRYVASIIVLSFGLLAIGFATRFQLHVDTEEQLTAVWSRLIPQRNWLRSTFPQDPYTLRIFVHAEGDNVLTLDGIKHAMEVVQTVQSTSGFQELCDAADAATSAWSVKSSNSSSSGGRSICIVQGITSLWNSSLETDTVYDGGLHVQPESDTDVILAVNADVYPDGSPLEVRDIMGDITYHYKTAVQARAFPMAIMIPSTMDGAETIALDVLQSLLSLRNHWKEKEHISNTSSSFQLEAMLSDYSIEQEMVAAVFKDIPLIPGVFVIMTIFTCLVFSTARKNADSRTVSNQPCQQRILLGLGAVVTILLSIATSYGLLWILGTQFHVLPFRVIPWCRSLTNAFRCAFDLIGIQ